MYVNQWNLSIQRQLGQSWLVSANYLGNSTIHMITSESVNPAVYLGLGPCTLPNGVMPIRFARLWPIKPSAGFYSLANYSQGQYLDGGIGQQDSGGTGSYEGLYLSANKRLSKNTSLLLNYTWSHCISDVFDQQTTATGVSPNIPIGGNTPSGDRNYYEVTAWVGSAPVTRSERGGDLPRYSNTMLRRIASDWQVAPIMYLRSAQFFTVTSGVDNALTAARVRRRITPAQIHMPI